MPDLASKPYWNNRAKVVPGIAKVMNDVRAPKHELLVKEMLSPWKHKKVLDVACGYGRFAEGMTDYEGIDFSEEMVKQANNPNIYVADAHQTFEDKWDVVFEVIALSSLKLTPKEFYEKWKPHAKEFVACFEFDEFYIFPIL